MKRTDLLCGLVASAAAGSRIDVARAASPIPLRVSYEPLSTLAAFYVGLDKGFFRNAGLDISTQAMNSGSAMGAAIVSGSIDLGVVNVVSLAQAFEKRVPLVYVAMASLYSSKSPADALMVPTSSPVSAARDLNAKTIAINVLGGLAYIGTRSWLDKNGGDSSSVRFVEMPFVAMGAALTSRSIDAALVAEPYIERAKPAARVLSYAYNAIAPDFLVSGWAGSQSWATTQIEAARRFGDALRQAEFWADRNRAETAAISARYLKVDAATLLSLSHAGFPERRHAVPLAQPLIDAAAKYGVLQSRLSADEIFSSTILR